MLHCTGLFNTRQGLNRIDMHETLFLLSCVHGPGHNVGLVFLFFLACGVVGWI